MNTISKSVMAELKSFDNLFIEMSAKSCSQRCKHCYINFPSSKKVEDFINIEIVQNALNDTKMRDIKCIYLTGAEPMTHPDFNSILRLCLKKSDVCICTSGFNINEKKARFLKKVEGESNNEIIFKISIDHYDEIKNDNIRYRGAFRDAVFAVKHLVKHDFSPIITVTNYYMEPENALIHKFRELFSSVGYDVDNSHICINPWYDKNSSTCIEVDDISNSKLDCQYGRILTKNGVYSCPFLAGDYRGRCGSDFKDFASGSPLETSCCVICSKSDKPMFGINFPDFE